MPARMGFDRSVQSVSGAAGQWWGHGRRLLITAQGGERRTEERKIKIEREPPRESGVNAMEIERT